MQVASIRKPVIRYLSEVRQPRMQFIEGENCGLMMATQQSDVFVVIPVYNRLKFTLACLECLKVQTYSPLRLIVVDGGSTDGTAEVLHRDHPDVEVLHGQGELWWGGAMHMGIEYALAKSRWEDDMVLMMNNDTVISPDYVETLVRVSCRTQAAVGALIVDSRDPSRILDAGEFIDWETYSFPVKTSVAPDETFYDQVDVLPGRGTLIPLRMARAAGNVNAEKFPHYIADYEFFCRLRRHGFRLGVSYETRIGAHPEETGLFLGTSSVLTFRQAWKILFSIRSMHNVRDHWRFIGQCAPPHLQVRAKLLLLWHSLCVVVFKTKLKALVSPGYVTDSDCKRYGLDAYELTNEGILRPWLKDGWYVFAVPRRRWWAGRPELRRLYVCAWNPIRKISRWLRAKMHGSRRVFVGALNQVPFGRQIKQAIKMCLALAPASWLRSLEAESPVDYTMLAARDALTYCKVEGKRVLVVGCNRGNDCTLFSQHGAGQVVGIDTFEEVGSVYRHSKVVYSQMSVESMGMKSGTCDLVFCFATMEHVSRIDLAFPEMVRVAKPGGIIYCVAAPLWHSSQGHHKRDFFHSYPWIHLRLAPAEIVEYCRRNNIVDASGRHTMEAHVQYMMNPRYFNQMAGSAYLSVCENLSDVEILRNELSFDREELFPPEIYTELEAKGYSKAELLAVVHTFVARKVGGRVSPFVKAG